MAGITSYNTDPSLNTTIQGVFIGENCPAGNLNDAQRAMASDLALWLVDTLGPLLRVAANTVAANTSILDGNGTARLLGYLDLPLTASTTGRAIALADRGYAVRTTGNLTIPTNATTAFPIGSIVGVYNDSASSITIAAVTPGTTTLRLGGSSTTDTRTLAQRGYCALLKVGTDEWVALNGGLT